MHNTRSIPKELVTSNNRERTLSYTRIEGHKKVPTFLILHKHICIELCNHALKFTIKFVTTLMKFFFFLSD